MKGFQLYVCHSGKNHIYTPSMHEILKKVHLRYGIMQNSFANATVTALGWGSTSFGGPLSTTLQEVTLNVISNAKCRPTYPNLMASQLCTFARDKDTCQVCKLYSAKLIHG